MGKIKWLAGLNPIIGTPNDDVLSGTSGSDCIVGLGGNDVINVGDGQDLVFAGDRDDRITSSGRFLGTARRRGAGHHRRVCVGTPCSAATAMIAFRKQ
jgi:Ca2+-binding RTX toxin-like protein